jgi:hypothetical protein
MICFGFFWVGEMKIGHLKKMTLWKSREFASVLSSKQLHFSLRIPPTLLFATIDNEER